MMKYLHVMILKLAKVVIIEVIDHEDAIFPNKCIVILMKVGGEESGSGYKDQHITNHALSVG